jgi:hypothetical protein
MSNVYKAPITMPAMANPLPSPFPDLICFKPMIEQMSPGIHVMNNKVEPTDKQKPTKAIVFMFPVGGAAIGASSIGASGELTCSLD